MCSGRVHCKQFLLQQWHPCCFSCQPNNSNQMKLKQSNYKITCLYLFRNRLNTRKHLQSFNIIYIVYWKDGRKYILLVILIVGIYIMQTQMNIMATLYGCYFKYIILVLVEVLGFPEYTRYPEHTYVHDRSFFLVWFTLFNQEWRS